MCVQRGRCIAGAPVTRRSGAALLEHQTAQPRVVAQEKRMQFGRAFAEVQPSLGLDMSRFSVRTAALPHKSIKRHGHNGT